MGVLRADEVAYSGEEVGRGCLAGDVAEGGGPGCDCAGVVGGWCVGLFEGWGLGWRFGWWVGFRGCWRGGGLSGGGVWSRVPDVGVWGTGVGCLGVRGGDEREGGIVG